MKTLTLFLLALLGSIPSLCYAQEDAFQKFRKEAEDYSQIYSGKTALSYSKQQYANHPYWETDEYRKGILSYQGRIYTDVLLRYDSYQEALNILNNKRVGIVVDIQNVDWFILNEVRFVPQEGRYQLILHDSPNLQLTSIVKSSFGNEEIKDNISYRNFAMKEEYILTVNGIQHEVKKRNSFIKQFPNYKKELKKYAKDQRLDFNNQRRQALTALAQYAESLIKVEHHEQ